MSPTVVNQDLLQAMVESLPADELNPVRLAAAKRFADMGFPTVGDEDWKYTNLSTAADISNAWLNDVLSGAGTDANTAATEAEAAAIRENIDAHWIVISDGIIDSIPGDALPGISISRIADHNDADIAGDDALSVFNAALLRDGLQITASANATLEKPIGILKFDSPNNAVTQTRIVVDAGANSSLKLIECDLSVSAGQQFTNSVLHANLADGANLAHVRIQNRDSGHLGVNRIHATLHKDASYQHNSFDLGGAMTRNDVIIDIAGAGAAVVLNGLYLAAGDQHIDNHTSILHGVGPATSNEEYRGILAGQSQCVFNGKVVVSPGADGTDSSQSNHNLLLSARAEIDTKPELEIYADDVKCAHGATVGQLDDSALFYLRTRGLDLGESRRVLTRAFAAGTLSSLAIGECHDYLAAVLDQRLAALVGDDT